MSFSLSLRAAQGNCAAVSMTQHMVKGPIPMFRIRARQLSSWWCWPVPLEGGSKCLVFHLDYCQFPSHAESAGCETRESILLPPSHQITAVSLQCCLPSQLLRHKPFALITETLWNLALFDRGAKADLCVQKRGIKDLSGKCFCFQLIFLPE